MKSGFVAAALLLLLTIGTADAQVTITQQKALHGAVTPGDAAGFPVNLNLPGTYVLEGNLNVTAGRPGIVIGSHDVTLDLNGFRIDGLGKATIGIVGNGNFNSATIKGGGVLGFTSYGIDAPNGDYWSIDAVRIVVNRGPGVNGRNFWTIRDTQIDSDGGGGVFLQDSANIQSSTVAANGAVGIACNVDCMIAGNNISRNNGDGVSLTTGTVLGNTIGDNGSWGLYVFNAGYVGFGNNTVFNNGSGNTKAFGTAVLTPLQPNACQGC